MNFYLDIYIMNVIIIYLYYDMYDNGIIHLSTFILYKFFLLSIIWTSIVPIHKYIFYTYPFFFLKKDYGSNAQTTGKELGKKGKEQKSAVELINQLINCVIKIRLKFGLQLRFESNGGLVMGNSRSKR